LRSIIDWVVATFLTFSVDTKTRMYGGTHVLGVMASIYYDFLITNNFYPI
jgi:hypothetical protein